ncbi:MAG: hypothetical protein ACRDPS_10025 [Nocardioides sp.]|uniref:hypothetical protein n=1 Tax=Nocardioides sp. TaxID=35761 RepID=UPI003D6B6397
MSLVLDSEAVSRLIAAGGSHVGTGEERFQQPGKDPGAVLVAALQEAARRKLPLATTAAVLSEQYRTSHAAAVSSFLGRNRHIKVVATDERLAPVVGRILSRAGRGSADHVDATVVATAGLSSSAGAVIATSDPDDIENLLDASGFPRVGVISLT